MKIQGPKMTQVNAYKNQMNKHIDHKNEKQKDQLMISNKAKQLQKKDKISDNRLAHINEIKRAIETGEYKIETEKIAQKMIDFWKKQS